MPAPRRRRGTARAVPAVLIPDRQAVIFVKTKMCKFNLLGACAKGECCLFAHSKEELNPMPDLYRTKLCKTLINTGSCHDPSCKYAHNKEELRPSTLPGRHSRPGSWSDVQPDSFSEPLVPGPMGGKSAGAPQECLEPAYSVPLVLEVLPQAWEVPRMATMEPLPPDTQWWRGLPVGEPPSWSGRGGRSASGCSESSGSPGPQRLSGSSTATTATAEPRTGDSPSPMASYDNETCFSRRPEMPECKGPNRSLRPSLSRPTTECDSIAAVQRLAELLGAGDVTVKNTFLQFDPLDPHEGTRAGLRTVQTASGRLDLLAEE